MDFYLKFKWICGFALFYLYMKRFPKKLLVEPLARVGDALLALEC